MKFSPFNNPWNLDEWQGICPEHTYKVVESQDFPIWLPEGLTSKFNSGVFAASGNTETYVAVFMGFRIDRDEIDEHPFVVAFDKSDHSEFSGIIHHGDWAGRTTKIPEEMARLMDLSGLDVDFSFERKPLNLTGTLEELNSQGVLKGYETAVSVIEELRGKRKK